VNGRQNLVVAVANAGRKDRRTDLKIQKPNSVFPMQLIHDGYRYARQVPQLLLRSGKTVKWLNVSAHLHFCVQNTEHKLKIMYKNLLQEVASFRVSEVQNQSSRVLMNSNCQRSNQHQRSLNRTLRQTLQGF
jgi:hypothetical protein